MITLRAFNLDDSAFLMAHYQSGMLKAEAEALVREWNQRSFKGAYFEMFAVLDSEETPVGWIPLYAHDDTTISAGIEVIASCRQKSIGSEALQLALQRAQALGYQTATAQVRKNNLPSIRLHERVGFTQCGECVTSRGGDAYIYELKL